MRLVNKNFLGAVSLLALSAQGAAAPPPEGAEALFPVAGEDGMAIDFTLATPDLAINWASTPSSEYNGDPFFEGGISPDAGKLTFTRASLGMKYNSAGTLEFSGHNLAVRSQEFNTTWVNLQSTDTANTTVAPDSTTTADTITDTGVNSRHGVEQQAIPVSSGTPHVFSCYVKAGTKGFVQVLGIDGVNGYGVVVNLSTGAVTDTRTKGTPNGSSSVIDAGSGWYRISVTYTTGQTSTYFVISISDSGTPAYDINNCPQYLGDSTGTIIVWGAQLQRLPCSDTAYIPTTTSAVYKHRYDHNPSTLAARGLLIEEQRTNLALRSQEISNGTTWPAQGNVSVTADQGTAPDGTLTADLIQATLTASSNVYVRQTLTLATNSTYALTVYAKQGTGTYLGILLYNTTSAIGRDVVFNLSTGTVAGNWPLNAGLTLVSSAIENIGSGWYRCIAVITTSATNTNYEFGFHVPNNAANGSQTSGDNHYIFGAQLELGAFATSYIPTTTASVTRAVDLPSIATSLFPYSATVGTMVAEHMRTPRTSKTDYVCGFHGAGGENLYFRAFQDAAPSLWVEDGFATQANFSSSGTTSALTAHTVSGAWALNDFATSFDGAAPATDTAGTLPTLTTMILGSNQGTFVLNGWVRNFLYLPRRATNTELQTLTA